MPLKNLKGYLRLTDLEGQPGQRQPIPSRDARAVPIRDRIPLSTEFPSHRSGAAELSNDGVCLHALISDRLSDLAQASCCQNNGHRFCQVIWQPAGMPKPANKTLRDQIARRLRAVQAVADASDKQMGDYVGLSRTAWINATRDGDKKVNKPSEEAMIRLCEQSGLTMEWIYRGIWDDVPYKLAYALKVELGEAVASPGEDTVIRLW